VRDWRIQAICRCQPSVIRLSVTRDGGQSVHLVGTPPPSARLIYRYAPCALQLAPIIRFAFAPAARLLQRWRRHARSTDGGMRTGRGRATVVGGGPGRAGWPADRGTADPWPRSNSVLAAPLPAARPGTEAETTMMNGRAHLSDLHQSISVRMNRLDG